MRSRQFVAVASLCLLAVLLAAIVPTASNATAAILDPVAIPCAPPAVRGLPGVVVIGPTDTVLVERPPARAPPLA